MLKLLLSCILSVNIFIGHVTAVSQGTVRLYRNGVPDTTQSWSSGIVQIYYDDQWGNICDDSSFGSDEADVICHQLGYSGASSFTDEGATSIYGTDSSPTVMDDVSCSSSSYLAITQCDISTIIINVFCGDSDDVIVFCYSTRIWDSPSPGDIRLTGGTYSNQGLLEVYCNGQWGTVCDDFFGATEARIACRQLGYNEYAEYDHLTSLRGDRNIWLRSLSGCSSLSDSCLTSCGGCPSTPIIACDHSEDITLECEYSSSIIAIDVTTVISDTCDAANDGTDSSPATPSDETPSPNDGTPTPSNGTPTPTDETSTPSDETTAKPETAAGTVPLGAIIGSIAAFIACLVISIAIPFCICMCFGVGLGASARGRPRTRVVNQPPTAATTGTQPMYYSANPDKQPSTQQPTTTPYYPTQPPSAPSYFTLPNPSNYNPSYNPAAYPSAQPTTMIYPPHQNFEYPPQVGYAPTNTQTPPTEYNPDQTSTDVPSTGAQPPRPYPT